MSKLSNKRIGRRGIPERVSWTAPIALELAALALCSSASAQSFCQSMTPNGPLFITPSCVDPDLNQPYIDIDQPGSTTDPATGVTVDYRYIHGGFTGSNTKFSFYFPSPKSYRGRFFESTYPTISQEDASPDTIAFAIYNGAYVVSSNNNGGVPAGGIIAGYRANAAAAKFSRVVAGLIYNSTTQPRGYIYGASGGAYQTLGAAENTSGVWDGTMPMVPGVPNAIPSFQVSQILGLRVLGDVLPQIADAVAPGGSGNPFAGLTSEQQATLTEVTLLGFPLRGWWQYPALNGGSFLAVEPVVSFLDPTYVSDFWSVPGYEGSDPALQALRIQQFATSVVSLSGTNGLVLANVPAGYLENADLTVTSGPLAGQTIPILSVTGNTVQLAGSNSGIASGNTVTLDNSRVLALQYYPRHQVPGEDEYGWNQYRGQNGDPLYPQRPFLVGPILDASTSGGAVATGHFYGKMIMLASTMDVQAYSWSADWYKTAATNVFGSNLGQSYRLWYMDNADHDPGGPADTNAPKAVDHIVPYMGEFQQALLYLDAWVASGVAPPSGSNYQVDSLNNVQVPSKAKDRGGVQPAVTLSAGGHAKITVAAGQSVPLTLTAAVPPQTTTKLITVEWDLQGTGNFSPPAKINPATDKVTLYRSTKFTSPGTYFPTVRITSQDPTLQPNPSKRSPYCLIQNLGSVRVVVR